MFGRWQSTRLLDQQLSPHPIHLLHIIIDLISYIEYNYLIMLDEQFHHSQIFIK
jgi:hypothetical protein